mmetsp:Transcript_88085/g.285095  ORF Transcript_88085/g.285095 Transcript_88085/m.285095 type:complete len:86 (-) Transcript_88085:293-550(-)
MAQWRLLLFTVTIWGDMALMVLLHCRTPSMMTLKWDGRCLVGKQMFARCLPCTGVDASPGSGGHNATTSMVAVPFYAILLKCGKR